MTKAARVSDSHECKKMDPVPTPVTTGWICKETHNEMVPTQHKGQPVMPAGSPNVKIEKLAAARCGDLVACVGAPPVDVIVTGSATVKINGMLAAMIGSRCLHDGTVTGGAGTVRYGDAFEGATFGDSKAATQACQEALLKRTNYASGLANWVGRTEFEAWQKTHPHGTLVDYCNERGIRAPSFGEQQKRQNGCGQETARTLCIQKCRQGNQKACAACSKTEEEFYADYMSKLKKQHNDVNQRARDALEARNKAKWEQVKKHKEVYHGAVEGQRTHFDPAGQSWESYAGEWLYLGERNGPKVYIEPKGTPPIDDPAEAARGGTTGSYPETREAMLRDWCGLEPAAGGNDTPWIARDLATGKTVVATVDVNALHGSPANADGSVAKHVVTVTSMKFDKQGNLVTVTMNDTAAVPPKSACGTEYSGADFEGSLVKTENGQGLSTILV